MQYYVAPLGASVNYKSERITEYRIGFSSFKIDVNWFCLFVF